MEVIMKTSVIGFPRIGTLRELKFASEKYFRKEIEVKKLLHTAELLRKEHWATQKNTGINYLSSKDFSFYDLVLDTAVLLGIIPKRYKELNLSELDTYFAMARGYQGDLGDVKALAMKKWFNTNYHYIVPEIDDYVSIKLSGNKIWNEYAEAKEQGIETKPVVIGAYTMLKLCKYTGKRSTEDYVEAMIQAYRELIEKCEENKISWIQFDEPSLVQDMNKKDIELFHKIYANILTSAKTSKVLLQTYFGDIRDVYLDVIKMPFAGIGLDFIEGKETYNLIKKYGFPKDKLLFAGLINGKNIWKNHYEETLKILSSLKEKEIQTVLSTSCSLLHVPYTLKHEEKLSQDYLSYFSFAEEKLVELKELSILANDDDYHKNDLYQRNSLMNHP